jgi:hypothetical protein
MSSLEKEKNSVRFSKEVSNTSSEGVNKSESVNKFDDNSLHLNTTPINNRKFTYRLQSISKEHRIKATEVALRHGRKSFNEVLDIYVFCYDFMVSMSRDFQIPLDKLPDFIRENLPRSKKHLTVAAINRFQDSIKNLVDEEKVEEVSKFLFLTLVNSGGKSL